MKYAFIFHFFIGLLVFSNDKILSSSDAGSLAAGIREGGMINFKRYDTLHVILFMVGNIFLATLSIFESTIFSWCTKHFAFLADMQQKFKEMDALSDDYYNEINLKFLICEYERAK